MKKINAVKITLDIIMTLIFVLLYNKMVIAGLTFHEVAGLAVGGIFLIHIGLNLKWVKKITANLFNKNIKAKTKLGYLVDVLLLFSMAYIVISGIFISRVVFPNLGLGNNAIFKLTHISASYLVLVLIGIHLGLHWNWVMGVFKKLFRVSGTSKVPGYLAKALVVIVFASGIYSVYTTGYISRLSSIGNVFSISQGQMPDKGMRGPENGESRSQFDGKARPDKNGGGNRDGAENSNSSVGNNVTPNSNGSTNNNSTSGSTGTGDNRVKGTAPNGRMPQKEGNGLPGTNPLNVIFTFLGIISVFAIVTYYLEKLLVRIRTGKRQTA